MESRHATPFVLDSPVGAGGGVSVTRIGYHGWPDCFLLANGSVEAVVVPVIGRILQLRATGDGHGVFWENRALDGRLGQDARDLTGIDAQAVAGHKWLNFGGDKCWPAPQSAWLPRQGWVWPPPVAFDAHPMEAMATERGLRLTSEVDPAYGIQVVRHVEMDSRLPVLRVRTEYRKLSGSAVRVGVWTISQMAHPECVGLLLAEPSKFAEGYIRLLDEEPAEVRMGGRVLLLGRHARRQVKIGADGASLAWVGRNAVVRIDAEAGPGEYPDGGCVTEVYTNPDPAPYVELETLGPLTTLEVGEWMERTTVYTVMARTTADPEAEARRALGAGL